MVSRLTDKRRADTNRPASQTVFPRYFSRSLLSIASIFSGKRDTFAMLHGLIVTTRTLYTSALI